VLDNFEQVAAAAPLVADLLATCPSVKILITSRENLHLRGEQEFSVPALAMPDPTHLPSVERMTHYEAVRLFIERAQATKLDFQVTNENVPAIAEICYRLDGLPLAIELAAARIKFFPPQALLTRLGSRLSLLTGGWRDLPARQQTLRNTIDWSYTLLNKDEQTLFARQAIFVGGWTIEAAESICNADGDLGLAVLDGLTSLVDKNLAYRDEGTNGEPRFMMLETIREYALEKLDERVETEALRHRHANYYLALAEAAEPGFWGPQQIIALERLELEHDNLRAALAWSKVARNADIGVRLATALWWFWFVRGYTSEGRVWLMGMLAQAAAREPDEPSTRVWATALYRGAHLAEEQGDYEQALALCEKSLTIFQGQGDRQGIAWALYILGLVAQDQGDYGQAEARYTESLALFQEVGDTRGISWTLNNRGLVALVQGDYGLAHGLFVESLRHWREVGNIRDSAICLNNLGEVARCQDNYTRAAAHYAESLTLFQKVGDTGGIALCLLNQGYLAHAQGETSRAQALCAESLPLWQKIGSKVGFAVCLAGLALVARAEKGQSERAARLFGAVAQYNISAFQNPVERAFYERSVAAVRAQLSEAAFAAAWAEGQALTTEQALAEAMSKRD